MMSFFAPKALRAEVTEGIDLEHGLTLAGQRVTVGTSPGDDLRLGAMDVVPGHLTFERRADGKGWEYFTSDRGQTQVDRGNPRTGAVRPGMWFRLGAETRIDIQRTAAPAEAPAPGKPATSDEPATIPLTVALPIMAVMAGAAVFGAQALTGKSKSALSMQTTRWVTGAADLAPALDGCLETTVPPTRAVAPGDPAHAFWRVMVYRGSDPVKATEARADLAAGVREILAEAYFLSSENRGLEAAQTLRRMEYVLPVGPAACPILSASRFDTALLELSASN